MHNNIQDNIDLELLDNEQLVELFEILKGLDDAVSKGDFKND